MLRSTQATHVPSHVPTYPAPSIRVRIGLEETAHPVKHLSLAGFSVVSPTPYQPGVRAHVSFQLPAGLSISFEAIARPGRAGLQRFDFIDADPELLDLLLAAADTSVIH